MDLKDYTPGQQKAIITSDSNIIVSAGAGSGKTAVLTERVLYFIKNYNYNINDFIILTFTNLAAGEMKERIRNALSEANLIDTNNIDTAQISTFDSYALSLVKKYHQQLNVSKDISIIDSSIISVKKRNIINEIFEEYYASNNQIFDEMIKKYCFKTDAQLTKLTYDLMEISALELDTKYYLDNFINIYYGEKTLIDLKISTLNNIIPKVREVIKDVELFSNLYKYPVSDKDPTIYSKLLYSLFEDVSKVIFNENGEEIKVNKTNVDDLYNNFFLYCPTSLPDIKTSNYDDTDYQTAKEKIKDRIKSVIEETNSYPKTNDDFHSYFDEIKKYSSIIIEIAQEAFIRLDKFKKEKEVYEFQDIAKMALGLVKNNEEVRNSIKNSTKMIMIDEYQDTSLLQDTFISYIANKNVYMVGDIKQSIYRFRNARSDLFLAKYNKYKNNDDGLAIDLNTNFRSRPEVLEDINYLFASIMKEEMGGANYLKDHMIEAGNITYDLAGPTLTSRNSDVLICSSDIDDPENIQTIPACNEAKAVALDIIDKMKNHYKVVNAKDRNNPVLRNCNYSDFCILADRGTDFDSFVEVFNQYQIPLFVENDEDISDSEIVSVLKNILKLVKLIKINATSTNELIHPFLSVARSFIYQYSDEKLLEISSKNDDKNTSYLNDPIMIKLTEIVNDNPTAPISDLFSKIVFELNLYSSLIRMGDVNKYERYLDLFLDNFKSMSKLGYSIDDFLLYLEYINEYNLKFTLTSSKSSIDSVKLMNVHKSKGLEFPIIYFVRLNKQFNRMELNNKYGVSSKYGMFFDSGEKSKNILKDLNKKEEINEDNSEKIRLFYVALTRTKEKMIFVVNKDNNYLHILNSISYKIKESLENPEDIESVYLQLQKKYEEREINFNIFEHIINSYDYHFTKSYISLTKEERCSISFNQALLEIQLEKLEEELVSFNGNLNMICNYLEKEYVDNKLDYEILEKTIYNLGYYLSRKFKENPTNLIEHLSPTKETIIKLLVEKYQNENIETMYSELVRELMNKTIDKGIFTAFFLKQGYGVVDNFSKITPKKLSTLNIEDVLIPTNETYINFILQDMSNKSFKEIYEELVEMLDTDELDLDLFEEIVEKYGYYPIDEFEDMSKKDRLDLGYEKCLEIIEYNENDENDIEDESEEIKDEIFDYSEIENILFSYIRQLINCNNCSYKIDSLKTLLNIFGYNILIGGSNILDFIKKENITIDSFKELINKLSNHSLNDKEKDLIEKSIILIILALKSYDNTTYNHDFFLNLLLSEEDKEFFTKQLPQLGEGTNTFIDNLEIIEEKIEYGDIKDTSIINKINYLKNSLNILGITNSIYNDKNELLSLFVEKDTEYSDKPLIELLQYINKKYEDKEITSDELNILNQHLNINLLDSFNSFNKEHVKYNELIIKLNLDLNKDNYFNNSNICLKETTSINHWFISLLNNYLSENDPKEKNNKFNETIKLFEIMNLLLLHKAIHLNKESLCTLSQKEFSSYLLNLYILDDFEFLCFDQLFNTKTSPLYTYRIADSLKNEALVKDNKNKTDKKFNIKNISVISKIIDKKRASKQIDLNVDRGAIEFGNKIHFMMEVIDFINPNYEILENDFYKNIVKRFLSSSLMKDVEKGKIYKEYEFYDEKNNTSGIIDLMIVYSDHIDIIDYKTKNIDDDSYIEQLKVYSTYIKNKFNKPINAYLYSLLTGKEALVVNL